MCTQSDSDAYDDGTAAGAPMGTGIRVPHAAGTAFRQSVFSVFLRDSLRLMFEINPKIFCVCSVLPADC